ncbi:MAG: RidA family protein [Balneolaceae bacterium]|nr:RidA family protein [Balneolaceae bacterium]
MDHNTQKTTRKSAIKSMFSGLLAAGAGLFGISQAKAASSEESSKPITSITGKNQQGEVPLFSSVKIHDGLVYVAGKGEHGEGDITVHTNSVLDQIEEALEEAGSSMDRVLKVNVYLHDIRDYDGLNAAYRGRFGDSPPVRTTVSCHGGIPGNSLVEIDCIAAL